MKHNDAISEAGTSDICAAPPYSAVMERNERANVRRDRFAPSSWWIPFGVFAAAWLVLFTQTVNHGAERAAPDSPAVWLAMAALHLPYLLILILFGFGAIERIGFYWRGRTPPAPGRLPAHLPTVCVQLPMFNEHAVARRVIEAAAALHWPTDRLSIQVLDDSTDVDTRNMVRAVCARVQEQTGVRCNWLHRTDRAGYKAGALEAGRRQTDAEFIAIFDADFVPPPDFLRRTVPHFYEADGAPDAGLALVQAQWGHLNDDESLLTEAQALWVDDHHSLQQSWRTANLDFVNFTGTAGIWRASAIETVGGWRSASLVEDCELSFRILFAGYRTRFLRDLAVPSELPQTYAAYRVQQKRWTQGWAQLQRLHLQTLLFPYGAPWPRKAYLVYWMCISWQWPLWALWVTVLPFLIANGLSLGSISASAAWLAYLAPPLTFALVSGVLATLETRHGQGSCQVGLVRRCARIIPYLILTASMLVHHTCAFIEGLFGPMHAEFERTPKTASVTAASPGSRSRADVPAPRKGRQGSPRAAYQIAESAFVFAQLGWIALFLQQGSLWAAIGSAWLAACIGMVSFAPAVHAAISRHGQP